MSSILRSGVTSWRAAANADVTDDLERASMEEAVCVMSQLAHDLNPVAFRSGMKDASLEMLGFTTRSSRYKVSFIIKAMALADMLRNSDGMKDLHMDRP